MSLAVEVCVGSVADATIAFKYGADTVEVCAAIELGGLTPTYGLVRSIGALSNVQCRILIRPRAGGFYYSSAEKKQMLLDIEQFALQGQDRFVIGSLTAESLPDFGYLKEVRAIIPHGELTFHRAFDQMIEPLKLLGDLAGCGVQRILTSGCANSAIEGVELLQTLVIAANKEGLVVAAAGGITDSNVAALVESTHLSEVHFSVQKPEGIVNPIRLQKGNALGGYVPDERKLESVMSILKRSGYR